MYFVVDLASRYTYTFIGYALEWRESFSQNPQLFNVGVTCFVLCKSSVLILVLVALSLVANGFIWWTRFCSSILTSGYKCSSSHHLSMFAFSQRVVTFFPPPASLDAR